MEVLKRFALNFQSSIAKHLSSISAAESGITPFNFLYLLNIRNFSNNSKFAIE
jgi:hypothetical protein